MKRLEHTIANLQAFRLKFEGLLEAARKKAPSVQRAAGPGTERLREVTGFGRNAGNLRMFVHVPERLPRLAPLVVALHGCSQTGDEYDHGTGWSLLADRLGFAVVYPEQQPANNPKNCFSWFLPDDIARGQGEALSIQQMVEHAVSTFDIDRRRIFVTGLSAGGAMAAVMLATYPELFAGGAIIAGLPYGCARTVQQAFDAMFTEQSHSARTLGDRVRIASGHRGPWPIISVWHGSADPIVKPSNAEAIIRQWTDVRGLSVTPTYEETTGNHRRRVWNDANGEAAIEAFSIGGMGHGVPLAAAMGRDGCGVPGSFFLEAGISSTHHIASFWRLGQSAVETSRTPEIVLQAAQVPVAGSIDGVAEDTGHVSNDPGASSEPEANQDGRPVHDPRRVIAAAFKAAGLPLPEFPSEASGTAPQRIAAAPIIAAALKAAGLTRT